MSTQDWQHLETLFHAALDRPVAERAGFLADACAGDEALRHEITEMLAAHGSAGRLSVEDRLLQEDEPGALAGRTIGVYRLVRLLGRGGMGDVYLAERSDEHYEQQVAFKLLRDSLPAAGVRSRFLQERQILAQLQHPNIAMLLDGGVTDDDRPYLVMQYVDGEPVTDHCRRQKLSLRKRLELLRTICRAVHAAHTNLVVHRDLKPANILVTAAGEVKLLDFGIAKLLDDSATGQTIAMDRLLTPEHAAPEQVAGEAITTATDVYALGVLLYELLTDERPIAITSSAPGEIERAIRETPPVPPSVRLPGRARELRGELDNIVLMALRKEPSRRYQSARELDDDIGRYLEGRPVQAQRDTVAYRARKFAARHRWGVAAAGAFLVLLVTAGALLLDQSRRVADERDRARSEQAKAEGIVDILTDLLSGSDPRHSPDGATLTRDDYVERLGEAVATLGDQPDVQARLWELLAGIHQVHSRYDRARDYLALALAHHQSEPGDPLAAARLLHQQALVTLEVDGDEAAVPLLRASLARHRRLLGELHPDVGLAAQDLASSLMQILPEEARLLLEQAEAIIGITPDSPSIATASVANRLGIIALTGGDHRRARINFERALELMTDTLGAEHPHVLAVTHNLGVSRNAAGEWAEAEVVHRRVLEARIRTLGAEAQPVARDWESLAGSLANQGRLDEALEAYGEALHIYETTVGGDSGQVSSTLRNIASVQAVQGRAAAAVATFDRALAIDRGNGGLHNRTSAHKRGVRALALFDLGQRDIALAEARDALADVDTFALGPLDPYRADMRTVLATMLLIEGNDDDAEKLAREAVDIRAVELADTHPKLARDRCLLASTLASLGRRESARELLAENHLRAAEWGLLHPLHRSLFAAAAASVGLPAP